MRKNKPSYGITLLSVLLGVGVFLFFQFRYPAHLYYQEQFQLFLFTKAYFLERVAHPGGFAAYSAGFLTQFFCFSWLGAAILAALLVLLQRIVYRLCRLVHENEALAPLSFLPSLLCLLLLCDENYMPAAPVSLIMVLASVLLLPRFHRQTSQRLYYVLMIPVLYFLCGPVHLLFALCGGLVLCTQTNRVKESLPVPSTNKGLWLLLPPALALAALLPLWAAAWFPYPVARLYAGVDYYRFPLATLYTPYVVWAVTVLLPLLHIWLPRPKKGGVIALVLSVVLAGGAVWSVHTAADFAKEETLQYDYLIRTRQWEKVVARANQKPPKAPMTVTSLNLALAKTGQLADNMFHYYQNGTEGLLPSFQRDFTSPLTTAEVLYHLGMINSAQRYAFEAMEAIPDHQKSTRCMKRLAETNLINGQYDVAAKYLHILRHTLYYRQWSKRTLALLGDEAAINDHPEYGWLRQIRYPDDYLFSTTEMDVMIGLQFQHNNSNRMAFEYLMAYELVSRNVNKFMEYFHLGSSVGYRRIPTAFQEALAFVWTQSHDDFSEVPWAIDPAVQTRIQAFARLWTSGGDNSQTLLAQQFGDTYWYYLLCRK